MTTSTLVNNVKVVSQTVGTGTLTLGANVEGYAGITDLINGATYSYSVHQDALWEYGRGVFNAISGTLTRGVLQSFDGTAEGTSPVALGPGANIAVGVLLVEDLSERVGIPANFTIGSVTDLPHGTPPYVHISGTSPNFVLDIGLEAGATGPAGTTPTFSIGAVTTLAPGSSATATLTGTPPAYVLNLGIPAGVTGATGATPVISIGTVTSGTPAVTIGGTAANPVLNFVLQTGATGAAGMPGLNGAPAFVTQVVYSGLNAITPSTGAGTTGFVVGPDTGTHTDANGLTNQPNTGKFTYQASPAGWIYVDSSTSPSDPSVTAALVNYAIPDANIGESAITAGTVNQGFGVMYPSLTTELVGRYLKQLVVPMFTTGNGFLNIRVTTPALGTNVVKTIRILTTSVAFTGTGAKTFNAGTHFPNDVWVPAGATVWVGCDAVAATGGVGVVTGASLSIPAAATNASAALTETVTTVKCAFQVTLSNHLTVSGNLDSLPNSVSLLNDGLPDVVLEPGELYGVAGSAAAYGDQSFVTPVSNNQPFVKAGLLVGAWYNAQVAGSHDFEVWRPSGSVYNFVNSFNATLTTGSDAYASNPAPFRVEVGDILVSSPIVGRIKSRSVAPLGGGLTGWSFATNNNHLSCTPASFARHFAMSGVIQRRKTARGEAELATRGSTVISNTTFPGTSIPAGYVVGGGPGISYNNGVVFTPGSLNYNSFVAFDTYSNAARRYISATIMMTDATAKVFLGTQPQGGNLLPQLGTLAIFDASAGAGAAVLTLQASGHASTSAPVTPIATVPWSGPSITAGGVYVLELYTSEPGYVTFTVRDVVTGASTSNTLQYGAPGTGCGGGFLLGKPLVGGLSGNSKCIRLRSETSVSSTPAVVMYGDSNYHGDSGTSLSGTTIGATFLGQLCNQAIGNAVMNAVGSNRAMNFSKSGADSTSALACLASDFTPFTPSLAIIWGLITNDANLTTWRTNTLAFIDACIAKGVVDKLILTTAPPCTSKLSLNAQMNNDIRTGYFAAQRSLPPIPYVNADTALSLANAQDADWNLTYTEDGIHALLGGQKRWLQQYRTDVPWIFPRS